MAVGFTEPATGWLIACSIYLSTAKLVFIGCRPELAALASYSQLIANLGP
jgi:hypothetical protein